MYTTLSIRLQKLYLFHTIFVIRKKIKCFGRSFDAYASFFFFLLFMVWLLTVHNKYNPTTWRHNIFLFSTMVITSVSKGYVLYFKCDIGGIVWFSEIFILQFWCFLSIFTIYLKYFFGSRCVVCVVYNVLSSSWEKWSYPR